MGRKPTKANLPAENKSLGKSVAGRVAPGRCADRPPGWNWPWAALLAEALIVLATVAAFSNSFTGPFLFDDEAAIVDNPTIRQLWPISKALCPPNYGESVTGRPLLNLSLAVNYAIHKLDVWSYHATNLTIHLLGSLLLFGILRRTFLLPTMRERWGVAATPLAFVIALFWAIHPLQTESVTYIIQRAESLVGLFYLLTLYCFVRGVGSARAVPWHIGAVLACLLGMASKEVMVSAPLIVLLYDRTFLAGSFREAWRRRGGFYLALAGTWVLLGWLVIFAGNRGGTAGFGAGMSWWAYLCTQFGAIIHYLRLCVWPHPLVLDYGTGTAHGVSEILPYAIVLGSLGAATVVALWRWPKIGFLGAWFFAILAPTSSVVPVVSQTVAEHRMYLPLAAVVTGLAVGGYLMGQRLVRRQKISLLGLRVVDISLVMCVAVSLGIVTFQRNADYHSGPSIWRDTVAKAPGSARAHINLGVALADRRQFAEAISSYRNALAIKPDYMEAHSNLGAALACRGQVDEAIAEYKLALEINPDHAGTHNNFGLALVRRGQVDEAIAHYRKALEINPDFVNANNNFGLALAGRGQFDEAIAHFQRALKVKPDFADAHYNLGVVLMGRGRVDEAIAHYQKALEVKPDYADAHVNLGNALRDRGQINEAIAHYQKALEIKPDLAEAHYNLGVALADRRQFAEAMAQFRRALESKPDYVDAHANLGAALAQLGRLDEAIAHFQKALELKPDSAGTRQNLELALSQRNGRPTTLDQRRELLRQHPNDIALLNNIAWTLATSPDAEAVELAERALKLSGDGEPAILDTLAAAYAESGRFPDAVRTAQQALTLATRQNKAALADALRARIRLYQAGLPYHAASSSSPARSTQP
jgi:tetratricopeptide (TPR) repeat protein